MSDILTFETCGYGAFKEVIYVVTIDAVDSHLLRHTWRVSDTGYVVRATFVGGRNKGFRLYREILGVTNPKLHVDHIDGNPLNNVRSNLRICSNAENCRNQRPRAGETSKYKGVSLHAARNKWRATIVLNGKQTHLGRFQSELDAAIAYNEACLRLHGEFARLNVIEGDTYAEV